MRSPTRRASVRRTLSIPLLSLALILLVSCGGAPLPQVPPAGYWPTSGWEADTPENQGLDSTKLADGLLEMRASGINIHSLLMVRDGKVILDATFYPYDAEHVHEVASVTKSVVTALIAIAADQKSLSLDRPVLAYFPDREVANRDNWKERMTIRNLAAMRSGLACVSDNNEQTLDEMGAATDWVKFALDLPMAAKPGSEWVYCSPATHLLSAIISETTGLTAEAYARQYLFEPLGITDVIWDQDPDGYSDGWAGLYMHPSDMAKIGYLWLHGGQWEGRQIVPKSWVEQSVQRQSITGLGDDYGYGWWVMPDDTGEFSAEGRSGQYIRVIPQANAVIVTTGGGFEWNQIMPYIANAVIDLGQSAPANPAGVARLKAAVAAVAEAPNPAPVPGLPLMASAVSGRSFQLGPNPSDLETLCLEFDGSQVARLYLTFFHQEPRTFEVGLDGVYRIFPGDDYGLPAGMRGAWIDERTFVLDYDTMANRDAYEYRMTFLENRVTVQVTERARTGAVTFEGTAE